jgi:mono/diheme cytochrome c family protein
MAATDQHYRNQKTLDIVFAVSCIAMLLCTLWMFWDDYSKPWKREQRVFRDVETAMNERAMIAKLPDEDAVARKRDATKAAREARDKGQAAIADKMSTLQARRDIQDATYRTIKADYDAQASYFVIASDDVTAAQGDQKKRAEVRKTGDRKVLDELATKLAKAKAVLDAIDAEIRKEREKPVVDGKSVADLEKAFADAEDDEKRTTGEFDRYAKTTALKKWKFGDTFRELPILDAFASPVKINQIWLPDLFIDYSFKEVPRFDRCTTCHLGIDRAMFDRSELAKLGSETDVLKKKLETAHNILRDRQNAGENLGFDLSDLPKNVSTVKLSKGQVTQFAAHPRLDLFVDANSPHAMEKFGCTICHSGQGSATDFVLASHTPADNRQHHEWHHKYGWESNHYWDYKMLSSRFIESSCLKCHHQITDLIRYGSRNEAPKVTRGYELVRENGCFGCHEINGFKSGRPIGPDVRAEPVPPLDWQTSAEQEKAKGDILNPPGAYRKVGPSLRRITEKTNEKWVHQWLNSPRGFRPDTKMPHFYNLSTNRPEVLPADQKDFPAVEMYALTRYIFDESKAHLEAKDTSRTIWRMARDQHLATLKEKKKLDDKAKKDLDDATKALVDLALLSVPVKAAEINAVAADIRTRQDLLQELLKAGQTEDPTDKLIKELTTYLGDFDKLATPTPIARTLQTVDGREVQYVDKLFAEATVDSRVRGRRLFVEKGCLACHSHAGTEKDQPAAGEIKKQPAVVSEANFGPNLSKIAAKLKDSTGKPNRRWLVQWIINPNLHHPRTRMPYTRVTDEEARDIADWLLAQDSSYEGAEPKEPDIKAIVALARLHLAKAPGMTTKDVDTFLPAEGTEVGITAEKLKRLPRDAEEQKLNKADMTSEEKKRDALLWYIGKKTMGRMGCFGCHDVGGFEQAKPIGTALQDWGKKDAERLAFEDAGSFVRENYHIVADRTTKAELVARIEQLDRAARKKTLQKLKDALTGAESESPLAASYENELTALNRLDALAKKSKLTLEEEAEVKAIGKPLKLTEEEEAELKELQERLKKEDELWSIKKVKVGDKTVEKEPYELPYYEALEHPHQSREGFIHLKLSEPRSYDFNRDRVWDDRLRMPQFQFARSRQRSDESDDDYRLRQTLEEAEAREAVMTFILGLTSENIPAKYLPKPNADRAAEIKGRMVIEKFNCAGCHQFRAGTFEFKFSAPIGATQEEGGKRLTPEQLGATTLEEAYKAAHAAQAYGLLVSFPGHTAWTGQPSPFADRLLAYGSPSMEMYGAPIKRFASLPPDRYSAPGAQVSLQLAEALRFNNKDKVTRDIPSGRGITLSGPEVTHSSQPFGGTFPKLILSHLNAMDPATVKDASTGFDKGPPPLNREGERVQPNWLFQFLLNPRPIRPHIVLNMPRFNMSPDEARAIVDYFVGVERQSNPGSAVEPSYIGVPQHHDDYWDQRNTDYQKRFKSDALKERVARYDEALKQAFPVELQRKLVDAKLAAQAADRAAADAKEEAAKKEAQQKKADAEKAVKDIQAALKSATEEKPSYDNDVFKEYRKAEAERNVYAADAYRLIMSKNQATCTQCHTINGEGGKLAPSLDNAHERLRPEWAKKWIANPAAMFSYAPVMSAFIKHVPDTKERDKWNALLDGEPLDRIIGVRDTILDLPRIANMPANRFYRDMSATTPPPP